MQRGEVWWANLRAPNRGRPVLLLSRNSVYAVRAKITVAPITRTVRSINSEVLLGQEEGMLDKCVVSLDDIQDIPKSALTEHITTLSEEKMAEVTKAVGFALDIRIL